MKNITRQHRVVASATNTPSNGGGGRNLALLGRFTNRAKSLFAGAVVAFAIAGCGGGGGGGSDGGSSSPAVNQAPTDISLSNSAIAENSSAGSFIGTIAATDSDSANIVYSFGGGTDDTSFTIDENNLSINISPDFETKPSYSIDITADDGELNFTKTLTISITDINDIAPVVTTTTATTHENIDHTASIVKVAHSDIDTVNGTTTYSITQNDSDMFEIDSTSGDISLQSGKSLDYETKTSYSIKVKVNDGDQDSTPQTIAISISDINDVPPVITTTTASANENITDSETIVQVIHTDIDTVNGTTTYSLTQDDSDMFEITKAGAVSLKSGKSLDYETKSSYSIKVKTNDGVQDSAEQIVTINVGDINDNAPVITTYLTSAEENLTDLDIIVTVAYTDIDTINGQPSWTLVDDTWTFEIDSTSGDISLRKDRGLNYNNTKRYEVKVTVNDGINNSTETTIVITIIDVNFPPYWISLSNDSIDENSPANTQVGTITSNDDGGIKALTYSFGGGADDDSFNITDDILSINISPDHEQKDSYDIKLKSTDAQGLSTTKDYTIDINDLNEHPTNISLSSDNIDENILNCETVGTMTTDDPDDGDTYSYSFGGGADDDYFAITNDTLSMIKSPNYETKNSYDIQLSTTDSGGEVMTKSFTIAINDKAIEPFVMKIKSDNTGTSEDDQFTVPTKPDLTYSYDIDCDYDGTFDATATGITGNWTCEFSEIGEYRVAIVGDFPAIYFADKDSGENAEKEKLLEIQAWGEIQWETMEDAFAGTKKMKMLVNDKPDLQNVTNMKRMFFDTGAFTQDISDWDVSNITNMQYMFYSSLFDLDISGWDVSNVDWTEGFRRLAALSDENTPPKFR